VDCEDVGMYNIVIDLIVIILMACVIIVILFLRRDVEKLSDTIREKEKLSKLSELPDSKGMDDDRNCTIKKNSNLGLVVENVNGVDNDDILGEICKNKNSGKYFIVVNHECDEKVKMIIPDGNVKILDLKLFECFEIKDLVNLFDNDFITKEQILRYSIYIEEDSDAFIDKFKSTSDDCSQGEPEYIKTYRKMLDNPKTFPSRMLQCITDNPGITQLELRKMLNEKFRYSSYGGSFSASLRVLLVNGLIDIDGIGDSKKIMLRKTRCDDQFMFGSNKVKYLNDINIINPIVANLLSENDRQKAFDEIISWQRYEGEKRYEEKHGKVGHVAFCPQQDGTPLVMVFHGENGKEEGAYTLLTLGGCIVSAYDGENYHRKNDVLSDVNADGLIERIYDTRQGSINYRQVNYMKITVLPMTIIQKPILQVLCGIDGNKVPWRWKLINNKNNLNEIVIQKKVNGETETVAIYYWSDVVNEYCGPDGGLDNCFWRIDKSDSFDCHKKVHQKLIELQVTVH
jgi:hypothetical protein